MTGDIDNPGETDQIDEDDIDDVNDDDDLDINDDDDSDDDDDDSTSEIDVEKLVVKIDAEEAARRREIRRKLEALREERDDEFGSTYNFDLDEKF
jgi:hypothetical protein